MIIERASSCPYCGESIDLLIDVSVESQQYVEDCQVCCRPIVVEASYDGEQVHLNLKTENCSH